LLTANVEVTTTQLSSEEETDEAKEPPRKKGKGKKHKIEKYFDVNDQVTCKFNIDKEVSDIEMAENDPFSFFSLFFDEDLLRFIHEQTLQYSGDFFSMEELKATLGVIVGSGVVSQSRRRDYWSSCDLKRNLAISDSISQKKFESIFSHLHFVPVDALPSDDKFQKIRILLSKLNKLFLKNAPKTNTFSIDEAMVPYYGRHGCKQHIKGKPVRFGFKMWCIATPGGYALQMQPYPGLAEKPTEGYDFGSSGNVIYFFAKLLRQKYSDSQLAITMDNYFSSLALFKALKEDLDVCCTGTIRKNRVPQNPIDYDSLKKSARGTSEAKTHESGVHVIAWHDNTVVTVASNCVSVDPVQTVKRYSRQEKKKIDVSCPYAVCHYNSSMGGVDRMDANVSKWRISVRGKKWYYPIFLELLDVALNNAWLLYRLDGQKMDFNTFKTHVAQKLLSFNTRGKKPYILSSALVHRFDNIGHIVRYSNVERRCTQCQKKTKYECLKCDKGLHPKDCFLTFHQR